MPTTKKGRIVYDRKRHYYDGYALFRVLASLKEEFASSQSYRQYPESYFWVFFCQLQTAAFLGERSIQKAVGSMAILDPRFQEQVERLGSYAKLSLRWKRFWTYRKKLMAAWEDAGVRYVLQILEKLLGLLPKLLEGDLVGFYQDFFAIIEGSLSNKSV